MYHKWFKDSRLAASHGSFGFYYSFSLVALLFDILISHHLQGADGILVPGGFGDRGVEGKILAAKYARENKVPFLGICLGMQIAVIEFARSVLNLKDANSTEFDTSTKNPCVIFMPEVFSNEVLSFGEHCGSYSFLCTFFNLMLFSQVSKTHMGGTMRLGSRRTYFQVMDCKSAKL